MAWQIASAPKQPTPPHLPLLGTPGPAPLADLDVAKVSAGGCPVAWRVKCYDIASSYFFPLAFGSCSPKLKHTLRSEVQPRAPSTSAQGDTQGKKGAECQLRGRGMLGAHQHPPGPAPTFRRMVWDMEALACMMMVAVLSSRISLRSGVGSLASSSIRTESVSLEIRNCRRSFSRFKRPGGEERTKPLRVHGAASGDRGAKARKREGGRVLGLASSG